MRDLLLCEDSHLRAMGFLPGHMLKIKKRASAPIPVADCTENDAIKGHPTTKAGLVT